MGTVISEAQTLEEFPLLSLQGYRPFVLIIGWFADMPTQRDLAIGSDIFFSWHLDRPIDRNSFGLSFF